MSVRILCLLTFNLTFLIHQSKMAALLLWVQSIPMRHEVEQGTDLNSVSLIIKMVMDKLIHVQMCKKIRFRKVKTARFGEHVNYLHNLFFRCNFFHQSTVYMKWIKNTFLSSLFTHFVKYLLVLSLLYAVLSPTASTSSKLLLVSVSSDFLFLQFLAWHGNAISYLTKNEIENHENFCNEKYEVDETETCFSFRSDGDMIKDIWFLILTKVINWLVLL